MNRQAFISGFNYTMRKYADGALESSIKNDVPMSAREYEKYYGAKYTGIGLVGVNRGTYERDAKEAYERYLKDWYAQHGKPSTNTTQTASTSLNKPLYYAEEPKGPSGKAFLELSRILAPELPERQPRPQEIASIR